MEFINRQNYRGPRPKSYRELRLAGFDTVINLESGVYDLFNGMGELTYPCDYGIQLYNLPCSDIFPPEKWAIIKALDLMQQDRHTYIHCKSGVDRTGFICAIYRMQVQNWSYEKAHQEWIDLGRHPWFFFWDKKLKEYEKALLLFRGADEI